MNNKRVHFIFSLPYALHLKDGKYKVKENGKDSFISINKVYRYPSSDPLDIGKSILELDSTGKINKAQNLEQPNDDLGEISYTEVLVDTEIPVEKYEEFIKREKTKDKLDLRPFPIPSINRFIDAYKFFGGEVYSRNLIPEDIRFLHVKFPDAKSDEFKGALIKYWSAGGSLKIASDVVKSDDIHEKIISALSDEKFEISLYDELLINARYFEFKGNYRMAIVESIIALESFLASFLSNKWKSYEISKKSMREHTSKIGLSEMLNFELPLVYPSINRELISTVKSVNTKRNKIIHQGFREVNKKDSMEAIEKIAELIEELKRVS